MHQATHVGLTDSFKEEENETRAYERHEIPGFEFIMWHGISHWVWTCDFDPNNVVENKSLILLTNYLRFHPTTKHVFKIYYYLVTFYIFDEVWVICYSTMRMCNPDRILSYFGGTQQYLFIKKFTRIKRGKNICQKWSSKWFLVQYVQTLLKVIIWW